ncbi:ficolin-1-like [Drosophila miranda]|uniref:ficolin-1-like n=1 Tax=Drosophila miranda TaxID=7229 RepID=UPI0007E6BA8F|nr:ficolin-1-like [Drosophila miranda]
MLRLWFLLLLLGVGAANRQRRHGKDRPDPEEVTNYSSIKVKHYGKFLDDCTMAKNDGLYTTFFKGQKKNSTVRCVASFFGGGWTMIQRRRENIVDFRRNWADYQNGFGDLKNEFWYGLEKIYRIAMSEPTEIFFLMQNTEGTRAYAMYDRFAIFGLSKNYTIRTLGEYKGEAGNGMQYHLNMPFSTYDRKNNGPGQDSCSKLFWGGWWYNNCYTSNLNGKYPAKKEMHTKCYRCIAWTYFQQYRPITFVQIMMRPIRVRT